MKGLVQYLGVTMTGLLAGNELGTLIGFHPAVRALPLRSLIEAEQALTARLGRIMPFHMTGTVIAAVSAAVDRRGEQGARLASAAAGTSLLTLAITLIGNVPLNDRTIGYPAHGGAAGWAQIRRRWERLHVVRVALDVASFAALTVAALADGRRAD